MGILGLLLGVSLVVNVGLALLLKQRDEQYAELADKLGE